MPCGDNGERQYFENQERRVIEEQRRLTDKDKIEETERFLCLLCRFTEIDMMKGIMVNDQTLFDWFVAHLLRDMFLATTQEHRSQIKQQLERMGFF